jgi:endonuclease V-like protein UPF0215 family
MPDEKVNFWDIKEEIRVLGIDDGPFEFGEGRKALLVGTVFRGGIFLEGVLASHVDVDGEDATEEIGLPVVSVTRSLPDMRAIKGALKKFPDSEQRWHRIRKASPPLEHFPRASPGGGSVFFQAFGIEEEDARAVLDTTSTRSLMPEPIRVAHIIASGVAKGESYGRV